jgi:hypothetical protein
MKNVYAKLQSGERHDALNDESIAGILNSLHPESNARATFYAGDDEWLSAFGCVSFGFGVSYQSSSTAPTLYCPSTLSLAEAQALIARFIRGEPGWQSPFRWRAESRAVRIGIPVLVVAIIASILILFARDIVALFK